MIIDTEKFIRDYNRMCERGDKCSECPLHKMDNCNSLEDIHEIAPIVIKWAEAHPVKTYLMDIKEKFPKFVANDSFYDNSCVKRFYGDDKKPESCIYTNCEDCWNREME